MKMKTLIGALAFGLFAITIQAQTNSPTPSTDTAQNNFLAVAGEWVMSIDYTKAWPTNEMDVSVGALWENNISFANYIGLQKNIGSFEFNGEMANAGVAGTIERGQVGVGYRLLNRGDLSINAQVDGGYQRMTVNSPMVGHGTYVQPEIMLRKIMAHGAYGEIGLAQDFYLKGQQPNYPMLKVGTGFTF